MYSYFSLAVCNHVRATMVHVQYVNFYNFTIFQNFGIFDPAPEMYNLQTFLKVALSQKILENFSIANINIPNHYPGQKI